MKCAVFCSHDVQVFLTSVIIASEGSKSKSDVSWDVLLNVFRGKSKDLPETLKSELTKEMSRLQMPIPEKLDQAFSDGFPCTCKEKRFLRHSSGTSGNSKAMKLYFYESY